MAREHEHAKGHKQVHHDGHLRRGGRKYAEGGGPGMVDEHQEAPERARGGGIGVIDDNDDTKTMGAEIYAGKGSKVIEKAEKRKRGGGVHKKEPMHVEGGKMSKRRLDRPGRKRGGSIGADTSPLTTAAKLKPAEGQRSGFKIGNEDD